MAQLSTPYTDPEHHNAQCHTDRQTVRRTDDSMMPNAIKRTGDHAEQPSAGAHSHLSETADIRHQLESR